MGYRRIVLTRTGGVEALEVQEEEEIPQPSLNEARIRVLAAGVARADLLMRRGTYPGKVPPLPYTPGYDIVGRVEMVNGEAPSIALGQMVAALTKTGGYSEYICTPVKDLVPVPEGLDPSEVAALVLNYLTAYQMMHRYARAKSGQSALIHAGASGVGSALLQLGKISSLTLYATASTNKLGTLEELGAFAIDYTREDFYKVIRERAGDGVDMCFDPIGGSHLWKSYRAVSPGGALIAYGELSTAASDQPSWKDRLMHIILPKVLKQFPGRRVVRWFEVYPYNQQHPHFYHQDLGHLIQLLAQGQIKPIIAARLPLTEVRRAHQLLESRQIIGKIILIASE